MKFKSGKITLINEPFVMHKTYIFKSLNKKDMHQLIEIYEEIEYLHNLIKELKEIK